jgi:outer membrane lipoprotein-sorting protein
MSKFIKALPILTILSTLFLSACQPAAQQNVSGFDFNTAKISYKISGSSEGNSEVIIKGDKKVIKTNLVQTKIDGTKKQSKLYIIQDGEKVYTLNEDSKTGTVVKNPLYQELQKLSPEMRRTRLIKEAIRVTESESELPKVEKQETIAGQACDVYKTGFTENCLWQAIPLKTVASLPDYGIETTTEATKVEVNIDLADSLFKVPTDYNITELN